MILIFPGTQVLGNMAAGETQMLKVGETSVYEVQVAATGPSSDRFDLTGTPVPLADAARPAASGISVVWAGPELNGKADGTVVDNDLQPATFNLTPMPGATTGGFQVCAQNQSDSSAVACVDLYLVMATP
jgi:hypothetical protein